MTLTPSSVFPGSGESGGGGKAPLTRRSRRGRRGLSIFEITLVIGIIVVVISGLITLFIAAQNNFRENRTAQLAQIIVSSVRGIYTNTNNYTGLTARMLINTGDIPGWAQQSASAIETPESRPIAFFGGDSRWGMVINTTRTGTCIAVLSAFLSEPEIELRTITNAADQTTLAAATGTEIANPTVALIENACNTANTRPILYFD